MKYLYKYSGECVDFKNPDNLDMEIVTPTILGGLIFSGEKNKSFKLLAVRFWFQFITLGKAKVYCYRYNGELVHTSYVIPKCFKFPFMKKK